MSRLRIAALAAATALSLNVRAEEQPPSSALDAPLFYQLLIGELELQRGEYGVAYQVLLDAARRTGEEALFRRAIQAALQVRAGNEAYAAARAWRAQLDSAASQQHVTQLAIALGRLGEAGEPLLSWVQKAPNTEARVAMIGALPQLLRNVSDRERPLNEMEPALAAQRDDEAQPAERRMLAAALIARLAQHAGNEALALNQLRQADTELRGQELVPLLALDLIRLQPDAEQLVLPQLAQSASLRTAYARSLARDHRVREALQQFEMLRELEPRQPAHLYAIASLLLELRQPGKALPMVESYLASLGAADNPDSPEARTAALLLKAQAHTELKQWALVEQTLAAVPEGNARETDVAFRRAVAEARQGKLAQARERVRQIPVETDAQKERRLLMEVQLLREAERWPLAFELLSEALKESPDDTDLLYEHAMSAERVGKHELMEQQLRRIIELDPRHHHAHNALGYSLADRNLRLDEARRLIERAIELGGHEPFLVDSLGWVAFREGNLDEAERWLRQAHRARPDAEIAAHLVELLVRQGKPEEARSLLAQAQGLEPENAVLKATRKRLGL